MREIVSPLSGIRSPFGQRRDPYKVLGFKPGLVADFGAEYYRATGRTTFGGLITQTRASNATMVDSTGTLVTVAPDEPRIGHHVWDGSAWVNEGLLHESEARTNLLLNSATLSTQDVTVTAVPHTLHFTGTGTVTLSGASTAGPLVGTGTGESNRVSLTFTPSAGTLTLTVSGTVTNADLEVGSTLSSHKPTSGSTATRAAETLTIPSANLPWPTPRVIGDELVTNGTFDSDIDWTKGTGWTIGSGVASSDGTQTAISDLEQAVSFTQGNIYKIDLTVTRAAGVIYPKIGDTTGTGINTSGTFTQYIIAGPGPNLELRADPNFVGTIDNVSVKEINPLAVSIQMEGRMTYADDNSNNSILRYHTSDNDYVIWERSTTSTRTGKINFFQVANGVTDVVLSADDTYFPDILVPFNIASRHGSTFINGAVDGTALTADTTPVALPDLSSTDLEIGYDFMGTIKTLRIWADDIGDAGLEVATS